MSPASARFASGSDDFAKSAFGSNASLSTVSIDDYSIFAPAPPSKLTTHHTTSRYRHTTHLLPPRQALLEPSTSVVLLPLLVPFLTSLPYHQALTDSLLPILVPFSPLSLTTTPSSPR
ncbi:hypothetical protein SLEP1_g34834 [Rubroshorea leprosula]|uniref:Uncharacterized protein n=1 Tax=Rubroshorea leprosula TaxID=152421 RepID=A0AAV5KL98_9ROSI|nr:hypothetical protein SLEP1_g34834 [Rubroshorea leprosula]